MPSILKSFFCRPLQAGLAAGALMVPVFAHAAVMPTQVVLQSNLNYTEDGKSVLFGQFDFGDQLKGKKLVSATLNASFFDKRNPRGVMTGSAVETTTEDRHAPCFEEPSRNCASRVYTTRYISKTYFGDPPANVSLSFASSTFKAGGRTNYSDIKRVDGNLQERGGWVDWDSGLQHVYYDVQTSETNISGYSGNLRMSGTLNAQDIAALVSNAILGFTISSTGDGMFPDGDDFSIGNINLTASLIDIAPSGDVPEPATLGLLALGIAGLGAARRRKG